MSLEATHCYLTVEITQLGTTLGPAYLSTLFTTLLRSSDSTCLRPLSLITVRTALPFSRENNPIWVDFLARNSVDYGLIAKCREIEKVYRTSRRMGYKMRVGVSAAPALPFSREIIPM